MNRRTFLAKLAVVAAALPVVGLLVKKHIPIGTKHPKMRAVWNGDEWEPYERRFSQKFMLDTTYPVYYADPDELREAMKEQPNGVFTRRIQP